MVWSAVAPVCCFHIAHIFVRVVSSHLNTRSPLHWGTGLRPSCADGRQPVKRNITLCGGSLGSCVDEERSQLRELM